jgi:hypothetical protein
MNKNNLATKIPFFIKNSKSGKKALSSQLLKNRANIEIKTTLFIVKTLIINKK